MITICTIMRMLPGIWWRMLDTKKLEKAVTTVNATHMTSVTCSDEVTASAEQMPRICRAMGLFRKIGAVSVSLTVSMVMPPLLAGC